MPEDSHAKSPPSGLHASAAPFVPVAAAKSDKANEGKQSGAGDAATSNSSKATAAVNGVASSASSTSQSGDNGSSGSTNQPATAASSSKGGAAAGKGQKGAGGIKQQLTSSKLAAAASAAPFVPGKTGAAAAAATPSSSSSVEEEPKQQPQQQQGKQGGRKHQHQRQQQARQQQQKQQQQQQQQQKDEQQKEPPPPPPAQQQQQQQQKEQKEQKDSKEQKPTTAGKMSAAAAAFVPKSTPATPAPATPAASSSSSNSQQQRVQAQAGNGTPASAARMRSPLKGSQAGSGGSVSSTSTAAATHASPARAAAAAGSTSSSRGGPRGGRPDSGASSNRGSSLGPGSSAGLGMVAPPGGGTAMHGGGRGLGHAVGPGLSSLGLGAAAGGPKRALLAHFQGSYQYGSAAMGMGGPFGGGYGQHHHHSAVPGKQLLSGQFMSEGLRQQLQQANYLAQLQYTPSNDEAPLPDKLGAYHTLYPLEDIAAADAAGVSSAWGVRTTILKGISARDGRAYALRAVCGKQVIPSMEMLSVVRSAVDMWSCLSGHPGLLVPLDGLVVSELDGSPSLVVVHCYVPGAVTLQQAHMQPTQTASGQLVRNTPNEELLWSYTVQLAGILRAVHATGLALRPATLHATKVLLTPAGRLKVCGIGVAEALTGEVVPANQEDLLQLQRDDVVAMGQLLLQLACAVGSLPSPSLDFASVHYSPEFIRLLMLLLGVADGGGFSWRAVSALLGERLLLEMDSLAMFNEQLLDDLQKEMENGRLFRLVSKLSFVTDRAAEGPGAHASSTAYTESGDRYLLSLFRDFVFHQGELDGGRVLDWGHVVECLNKLDAGVSEQVLLQSRDERSLLVVSYADVKRAIEAAVAELRTRGNSTAAGMMRGHGSGVGIMFGTVGR